MVEVIIAIVVNSLLKFLDFIFILSNLFLMISWNIFMLFSQICILNLY